MASPSAQELPFVSILLAVRNEEEHIGQCLQAIALLDYPREQLEIIVIDGNSKDRTKKIVQEWTRKDNRIQLLENPKQIVSTGMNLGLKSAKGDYIVWTSGHVLLQPEHLRQCWATMVESSASAVGGMVVTQGTTAIGRINAIILSNRFGVGGGEHRVGGSPCWVPAVTMALYRKQAIFDAGGFDEELPRNQDNDLHERMNALGLRSYFNPEIRPVYLCRNTLGGLLNQAWKNGYWNMMLQRMGKKGLLMRHYVPLLFVLSVLLSGITALFSPIAGVVFLIICGCYFATSLLVSIWMGFTKGQIWQIPLFVGWFAMLHFTYGVSSVWGLVSRKSPS